MITLSVIIPTFNSEKTIGLVLQFLYASTYKNFEVIIVDDCSTDKTVEIAKRYSCEIVYTEKNSGPAAARNLGVEHAQGEIILFLDSDILINKDALQRAVDFYRTNNHAKSLVGIYSKESANKGIFQQYMALWKYFCWTNPKINQSSIFEASIGSIKKETFIKLGGFSPRYKGADVEDYEFGYRLSKKYTINLDHKIQGKHFFPAFKLCAKNYFKRSSQWFELFLNRKQFDTGSASATRGLASFSAFLLTASLLLIIADVRFIIPSIILLCSFVVYNIKFYLFVIKQTGVFFTLYSISANFILSIIVIAGVSVSLFKFCFKKFDNFLALSKILINRYPSYVILFVTSRCNSKCLTCFYWKKSRNSNTDDELKIDEIEKISKNFNKIYYLTLTGGEPFLRDDLADIAETFVKNCQVKILSIPTNGIDSQKIAFIAEKILLKCPQTFVRISLSLDGINTEHDKIRGVEDNFLKIKGTYDRLNILRSKYNNFDIDVSTVFNKLNQDNIIDIYNWVEQNWQIDNHVLLLTRGDARDKNLKKISIDKYKKAVNFIEQKVFKTKRANKNILQNIIKSLKLVMYDTIYKTAKYNRMHVACKAGNKMVVINEQGIVYPCEILNMPLGNLRTSDYNIKKIIKSDTHNMVMKIIKDKKCHCTFECAIQNSLPFSLKHYPRIFTNFLKLVK